MTFITSDLLADARAELHVKSVEAIEHETAARWAARAVAAFELAVATGSRHWFKAAIEFRAEAIEHAASAGRGAADAMNDELAHAFGAVQARAR